MIDSGNNKTFRTNNPSPVTEETFRASLDLTQKPAGSYYFNSENNYNYAKSWFNYPKFDIIGNDTVIDQIVQYSAPTLSTGTLNTSKTFQLSSTSMVPEWIARVETSNTSFEVMTSNTTPVGYVASASSVLSPYEPYLAFDKNIDTFYHTGGTVYQTTPPYYTGTVSTNVTGYSSPTIFGEWIQLQLPYSQLLSRVALYPRLTFTRPPQDFMIVGSNDGINWNYISDYADVLWPTTAPKSFPAIASSSYSYFRLIFTRSSGSGNVNIASVEFISGTFETSGFSGIDLGGSMYLLTNYSHPNNAVVYNQDNTIAFTQLNNGVGSTCFCITKFNAAGYALWSSRILTRMVGGVVTGNYCVTDNLGTTYILGTYENSNVVFIGSILTTTLTVTSITSGTIRVGMVLTGSGITPGTVVSAFGSGSGGIGTYTVSISQSVLSTSITGTDLIDFEDSTGTIVFSVPMTQKSFIVAYNTLGVPDWLTYTNINQNGILWADNQVIGNLYVYGAKEFYDNVLSTPVLQLVIPTADDIKYTLAKYRSTSGIFQWGTYIQGYRLNAWIDSDGLMSQSITTDLYGNLYATGYFSQLKPLVNASLPDPTNPSGTYTPSDVNVPPISNSVVWTPREVNRDWSAVDISTNGQFMVATVNDGYIYVSVNYGTTWIQRATRQVWSSVYCSGTGQFMIATVMDSVIYVSGDYGTSWSIALGEGSNARAWQTIAGNSTASQLVACVKDGQIYYSVNQGSTWVLSASSILANWVNVTYNGSTNSFIALVKGGQAYRSTDGGVTWTLLGASPTLNWSSISSFRGTGTATYPFVATVQGGDIYGINSTGTVWTIIEPTNRNWSDIAIGGGGGGNTPTVMFATVFDGSIYEAIYQAETEWTPTTIPRNWNHIAMSADNSYAIASVKGGQLYTSTVFYPYLHSFLVKYDPNGKVQWANYVNSPSTQEADNIGVSVTTNLTGNVILSGSYGFETIGGEALFYTTTDFVNPVKKLTAPNYGRYLVCYSSDGIPLWVTGSRLQETTQGVAMYKSLSVDNFGNICCIGTARNVYLYQPSGQLVYSNLTSDNSIILVKYYLDGSVQSFTRINNGGDYLGVSSIRTLGAGNIFLSGWKLYNPTDIIAYTSAVTTPTVTETFNAGALGAFVIRYNSFQSPSITFPSPGYNTNFDTQYNIGGSTRNLYGEYIGDGAIELWGSKTGLLPSTVNTADLNASVISYLGHEPGYTIPVVEGIQSFSAIEYNHLVVGLSEPTFPQMDPQPITTGTIPYGFLPIFLSLPVYASGTQFNNALNNDTDLILSTTGVVSGNGQYITGVSRGDRIRILFNIDSTAQYLNLTVKGFIPSDVVGNSQAGIVFEESTRYTCVALKTLVQTSATLIISDTDRYVPAFYQPILVNSGTLNLIVHLYPKQQL
jgi:hypothetical protein